MTSEELLKPRYKVISDWPNSLVNVGQILDSSSNNMNKTLVFCIGGDYWKSAARLDKYPHLFKKLQWWEERTFNELPKYIKWRVSHKRGHEDFSFFKVENWYSDPNTSQITGVYVQAYDGFLGGNNRLFIKDCEPADEQEYNEYLKSN